MRIWNKIYLTAILHPAVEMNYVSAKTQLSVSLTPS